MSEQRCTNKIVVESGDRLAGIYVAKLHEGGFVLWLDYDGLSEVILTTDQWLTVLAQRETTTFGTCSSLSFFFR